MKPILEVCCGDIESVLAANAGGAGRIELCSALSDGGVTPSAGLIMRAVEASDIPVNVLIRPRGGDFLYNADEVAIMIDDINMARSLDAHGVVIGALTSDGLIDLDTVARLKEAAGGMSVTFHRAFDLCRNASDALNELIHLGCDRVLTSGQRQTAIEGIDTLRQLREQAQGKIMILAGAGINADSARTIIATGAADEVHASCRREVKSPMQWRRPDVSMGTPGTDEYSRKISSANEVQAIVNAINI